MTSFLHFRNLTALVLAATFFAACGGTDESPGGDETASDPAPAANNGPAILDPEGSAENAGLPMPAPAFELTTLSGESLSLEERRGDVILLNFWATWCGPCIIEIPDLQELHETYGERGLTVLGVSVEEGEEDLVRDFVAEMGMTYPVAVDAEIADAFGGVYGLPTTFVIDRNGQVVERIIGLFPTQEMTPRLQALLDEDAV